MLRNLCHDLKKFLKSNDKIILYVLNFFNLYKLIILNFSTKALNSRVLTLASISPSPVMSNARNAMSRYLNGVARMFIKKQKSVYVNRPCFWI